jgi:hypothetical protein
MGKSTFYGKIHKISNQNIIRQVIQKVFNLYILLTSFEMPTQRYTCHDQIIKRWIFPIAHFFKMVAFLFYKKKNYKNIRFF